MFSPIAFFSDLQSFSRYIPFTKQENRRKRRFILTLSFVIGVLVALAGVALRFIIEGIAHLLTHSFDETQAQWGYLVYPVVGIFITALFIKYVVRDDIGHGITKILYAISRRQGHIRSHNCWSSIVASGITIGCGGSVGAESPIVLTGSAIGSTLGQVFKLDHRTLMLLVGCGASGAIAGMFKAPIAGLVFSLEVLMLDLTMASLMPLLIACVTAACVTYVFSGTASEFHYLLEVPFAVEHVPTSIALGVFCGFISIYFTKAMTRFEGVFRKFSNLYVKLALGGTVLSVLIFLFPPLYGQGYNTIEVLIGKNGVWEELMNNSLFYGHSEYLLLFMGLIVVTKVFATTATTGGGGCGGTFAPSLFLGCVAGGLFARLYNTYEIGTPLPEKNYALLGMAGILSGVMHAPLTGVFLIAETTSGFNLFVPLMIVAGSSYLTMRSIEPHSIYTQRLAARGQLLTHHKDQSILTLMTLDSVIDKSAPTIGPEMSLGQFVLKASNSTAPVFAVVDRSQRLLGLLNLRQLRRYIFRTELYTRYSAEELMQPAATTVYSNEQMSDVMQKFERTDAECLPVLSTDDRFIGFVYKDKLYATYRKVLVDFSQE